VVSDERRAEMLRRATSALTQAAAAKGWAPDTEWFASDRDGHVAVFSTAGLGPLPARVTADPAGHVAVWEALERLGMPIGLGELDFSDIAVAPRVGAFAFDYSGMQSPYGQYAPRQPYRRVGTPQDPVNERQLSAEARAFLATVRLPDISFADVDSVVVEDVFQSVHRPTVWDRS
jgi:hypothetical protein